MNRGRPTKATKISQEKLLLLPESCSLSQAAKLLDISFTTLRMWAIISHAPIIKQDKHWVINKSEFITWLTQTGRV